MGCQASVVLDDNLTFSICTHDADTGALTDTSAPPAYRVYEDETGAAILTGNMAKLDDPNTTGFYTAQIACTTVNGFEVGKSYTIYIEATVDGVMGGIAYAFTVRPVDVSITSSVKQGQALANFEFLMTDALTHAPKPAIVPTATRSIDGGAFAAGTLGAVVEVANGIYRVDFAAADLAGKVIVLQATEATCDTTFERLVTQP